MKTAMREGTGGLEEAEKNHTIIKDTERGTGKMASQSNGEKGCVKQYRTTHRDAFFVAAHMHS